MGEPKALVVVNDAGMAATWRNAHVVRTMLDMIAWLERAASTIVTVILGGDYAQNGDIVAFLRETYPAAVVVISSSRTSSLA